MSTFQDRNLERLRRSFERLEEFLQTSAPHDLVESEAALIIRSLVAAFGPRVLSKFGELILTNVKIVDGECPYHDDDASHPIKQRTEGDPRFDACDDCIAEEANDVCALKGGDV
jgi:hypothetical protein